MRILCLGDSITDCNRLFSMNPLGDGYVAKVQSLCHELHPDWTFINRGVDGFTISRLLQNVHTQYLSLRPDLVTILIGINDVSLILNTNRTEEEKKQLMSNFFYNYETLLRALQRVTPHICLMEPFIFPYPEEYRHWIPYLSDMSEGIASLAHRYHLPYLSLQQTLLSEADRLGFTALTTDGVHLTDHGHDILANTLYKQLCSNIN